MIPLRVQDYVYSKSWPKYIIIHHSHELDINQAGIYFDTSKFQYSLLMDRNYAVKKQASPPYHYIIDKVGQEYLVMLGQPLLTETHFQDMDTIYNRKAIHIGLLGNYDEEITPNRLYAILAHRCICPLIRLFNIDVDDVLLHRQISTNDEEMCPGEFFKVEKLRVYIRTFLKKMSLSRR